MPIRCEIVSQDRSVFSGNVDMVILPGVLGEMGILPHHSPVLTVLKYGIIRIKNLNDEQFFTVAGGIAEVQPDQVTVLADAAENVEEIDIQRAETARQRAEAAMKVKAAEKQEDYMAIQSAIRRSALRLDAARRYKQGRKRNPSGSSYEGR